MRCPNHRQEHNAKLKRKHTPSWSSRISVILIPSSPPAHEPLILRSDCASDTSDSYVGTYGGLNTNKSTAREIRGSNGVTREAVRGSRGIYWRFTKLSQRWVWWRKSIGCTLFCVPVRLVQRHACELMSVVRYTTLIFPWTHFRVDSVERHTGCRGTENCTNKGGHTSWTRAEIRKERTRINNAQKVGQVVH